jgi:acyl-CoA dehydrogenase
MAPEAINCAAPDTGNMELLALFGTDEQKHRWLEPLLDGEIRSAFSMTEPAVASSAARNIATRITRDGDEYVISGHKWWTSGAMSPRCELLIVMGVTDTDAESYRQQSMILVPKNTPVSASSAGRCSATGGPRQARGSSTAACVDACLRRRRQPDRQVASA